MGFSRGPSIIRDGLVLALDAGSPRSYPGSGTTWVNLINGTLNASLINGVSYSSNNNGVMVMDGTNDAIYAPSVNSLGKLPSHALEIWVKSSGLGPGKSIGGLICPDYGMISYIAGNGTIVYYLYNTDNQPWGYLVYANATGINMFDNNWHHVVCTRNPSTYHVYVDGVSRASGSGGGAWSGATVWSDMAIQIGNNPNDAYYNLLGNVGIARIYNKYLTEQEVLINYNAIKGRFS
jgi:hypothetical protein